MAFLEKIPRTMKLFTLFFACSLGLAHASESYAQTAIVNVEVQNKTVGEILKKLKSNRILIFSLIIRLLI